jgi:hypothetical protein
MDHTFLQVKIEEIAENFVNNVGVLGPPSRYNDKAIPGNPEICCFVFEFIQNIDRFLACCIFSGINMSGHKTYPVLYKLGFAGSVVGYKGWLLSPFLVDKVLLWLYLINVSKVQIFLGLSGGARRWIAGYTLIAYPLTQLLCTDKPWEFDLECRDTIDILKTCITSAPILVKVSYEEA